MLEQRLRQELADNRIYVFNAGMGSGTSYRSLVILLNLLTRLSPDLVIVYQGVNDRASLLSEQSALFPRIGYGEEFLRRPSYILHELALRTRQPLLPETQRPPASSPGVSTRFPIPREQLPKHRLFGARPQDTPDVHDATCDAASGQQRGCQPLYAGAGSRIESPGV